MIGAKKPRADSKLGTLPEKVQDAIAELCRTHTYEQVVEFLAKKANGLVPPIKISRKNLIRWYRARLNREWISRLRGGRERLAEAERELGSEDAGEHYEKRIMESVNEYTLDLLASGEADPKQVAGLVKALVADRKQQQDAERLQLEREKWQRDTCEKFLKWYEDKRAREIAEAPGVSQGEKLEQLGKAMFGELWES